MSRMIKIWSSISIGIICLAIASIGYANRVSIKKLEQTAQKQQNQVAVSNQKTDQWVIRDAYARLMRYHSAERDEKSYTSTVSFSADDYIVYAINNLHSRPIEELLKTPISDLVTERSGEVLKMSSNYKQPSNGLMHVSYTIEWEQIAESQQLSDQITVQNILQSDSQKYNGVVRYTSYEVTVLLGGKQRTYKALAFHYSSRNGNRKSQTIILDNISPNINTLLEERYPQTRVPWEKYVNKGEFIAVSNSEYKLRHMTESQMAGELEVGYLAGDEVAINLMLQSQLLTDAACPIDCANSSCNCTSRLSAVEWDRIKSLLPNLKFCNVCKTGEFTETYNCMAWTLDDTSRTYWDEADTNGDQLLSVSELNAFYSLKGKNNIAYYGSSSSDVLHVAKKAGGSGSGCNASSKLGPEIRISHDLNELAGGNYGNIVGGN